MLKFFLVKPLSIWRQKPKNLLKLCKFFTQPSTTLLSDNAMAKSRKKMQAVDDKDKRFIEPKNSPLRSRQDPDETLRNYRNYIDTSLTVGRVLSAMTNIVMACTIVLLLALLFWKNPENITITDGTLSGCSFTHSELNRFFR